MDGTRVYAWLYFPGFKVGKKYPLSFFSDYLVALYIFLYVVWSTIIPQLVGCLELFSLAVFC
jgi:hypothetical protein